MKQTNVPLGIKQVFLSFAQAYYATVDQTFTWDIDPRKTKIFIGDKYAVNPAIVERMPSIILSRGTLTWAQTSINQLLAQDSPIAADTNKFRTDLVRANVTLTCTSRNGVEAEAIANTLFVNLVGFKDQLRVRGIHQILGISMGDAIPVRGDVESRLMAVPINILFTVQTSMVTTNDYYDIQVFTDLQFTPLTQAGIIYDDWYSYLVSGNSLVFSYPPPEGVELTANYKGKYTLQQYTDVVPSGIIDGVNTIFTLGEDPFCMYDELYNIIITVSGVENE